MSQSTTQAILVHIPCVSCSYYVQLNVLSRYASYKLVPVLMSPTRVNISETVFFYNAFKYHHELDGVIWVDTKFNVRVTSDEFPHAKIYTTSKWNAELLPRVDGILPRVVDVELARKFWGESKKYDFVLIASTDKEVDHKHVLLSHKLLKRLGVRERSVIISNVDVADYPVFSLSEEEKYKLLAQSYFYLALSGSEGFGLPPVEAMSVGTIPVYLDAHAFKEWLRGIPVRVSETREVTVSKLPMVLHVPDEEDALEKMKYALSIRHEKEYKEMSEEVKKYAINVFHPIKLTRTIPYFSR